MVLDPTEEFLYRFKNIEKGESAFNRLVKIQIRFTVVDYIGKEFHLGLASGSQSGFFQLFIVSST